MTNNMTSSLQKEKGFTLIELIIVIIILGILAVTAAPKFIDIQSDARESVMQGISGSVQSAITLVHTRALLDNQTGTSGSVSVGTSTIALKFGYPTSGSIDDALDFDSGSITFEETTTSAAATTGVARFSNNSATAATCNVTYTDATAAGNTPTVVVTVGTC